MPYANETNRHIWHNPVDLLHRLGVITGALILGSGVMAPEPITDQTDIWKVNHQEPVFGESYSQLKDKTIRIATYNIHAEESDTSDLEKFIDGFGADFIGLEESVISAHLEFADSDYPYSHFMHTTYHDGEPYGISLLSKFPIIDSVETLLPVPSGQEARGVLFVKLMVADNSNIWVGVTHLTSDQKKHDFGDDRDGQIDTLLSLANSLGENDPVFLIGDFNFDPDSENYDRLTALGAVDVLGQLGIKGTVTLPASRRSLDRLLFIDESNQIAVMAGGMARSGLSDHELIGAEIVISKP